MKVVKIIGDSLACPREEYGLHEAYPYRLQEQLGPGFWVVNESKPGNYSAKIADVPIEDADFLVLHVGIVDCAPRVFSRAESYILGRFRVTSALMRWALKHRHFLTRWIRRTYTSVEDFDTRIRQKLLGVSNAIILGIPPVPEKLERRSSNFNGNVARYNEVLQRVAEDTGNEFIHVPSKFLLDDGIHLNGEGHRYISENVGARIKWRFWHLSHRTY